MGRELRLIDCDRVDVLLGVCPCEELSDDVTLGVGDTVDEFEGSIADCVCVLLADGVGGCEGDGFCVGDMVAEGDRDNTCVPLAVRLGVAEGDGDCVGLCDKLVDALGVPEEDRLAELLVVCDELIVVVVVCESDEV